MLKEKENISTYHNKTDKRPYIFNKKYCIISARVHPELTGQWAFLGFLELLLTLNNYHSKLLREHFVFKLIPIVNPDGVSRGH